MGLALHNVVYKGRTNTLYSNDGKKWFENRDLTIPADETKIAGPDNSDGFFIALIMMIIVIVGVIKMVSQFFG